MAAPLSSDAVEVYFDTFFYLTQCLLVGKHLCYLITFLCLSASWNRRIFRPVHIAHLSQPHFIDEKIIDPIFPPSASSLLLIHKKELRHLSYAWRI